MVTEDLKRGYDKEEEYFHQLNQKLIEKKRHELDAQKSSMAATRQNPHWMKCPKCGHDMVEKELAQIKIDQCSVCEGVYFDAGELDILLQAKEPHGFLGGLKKFFK